MTLPLPVPPSPLPRRLPGFIPVDGSVAILAADTKSTNVHAPKRARKFKRLFCYVLGAHARVRWHKQVAARQPAAVYCSETCSPARVRAFLIKGVEGVLYSTHINHVEEK